MTKTLCAAGAALVFFLVSAPFAAARDLPQDGVTTSMIVTWLQGHGYSPEVKRDNTANSDYVAVSAGGVNWSIYFYNCTGGNDSCHQCADACTATAIQYAAGWNATGVGLDKLNAWNRDKRYLRTYSDTGGAVWAEYDIDVAPGGTWEQLDNTLVTWNTSLGIYRKYIGQ